MSCCGYRRGSRRWRESSASWVPQWTRWSRCRRCSREKISSKYLVMLRILSAGAAQAVVEEIAAAYTHATADEVKAEFSAVGAMKARVVAGGAGDVVVVTPP